MLRVRFSHKQKSLESKSACIMNGWVALAFTSLSITYYLSFEQYIEGLNLIICTQVLIIKHIIDIGDSMGAFQLHYVPDEMHVSMWFFFQRHHPTAYLTLKDADWSIHNPSGWKYHCFRLCTLCNIFIVGPRRYAEPQSKTFGLPELLLFGKKKPIEVVRISEQDAPPSPYPPTSLSCNLIQNSHRSLFLNVSYNAITNPPECCSCASVVAATANYCSWTAGANCTSQTNPPWSKTSGLYYSLCCSSPKFSLPLCFSLLPVPHSCAHLS